MSADLTRKLTAELLGTSFLVAAIVGSGIAASRLSPSDTGLALLENAIATGAALVAIILVFGPVSGAHINPAVTAVAWRTGLMSATEATGYVLAQLVGGLGGAVAANLMFGEDAVAWATTERDGAGLLFAEGVATVGLILVVFGLIRAGRESAVAGAVGAYIAGAYFFTSSTSFANPAVTLGRSITDTFTGIDPSSVPGYLGVELLAIIVAVPLVLYLWPSSGGSP